jgi:outer membrane protein TolC
VLAEEEPGMRRQRRFALSNPISVGLVLALVGGGPARAQDEPQAPTPAPEATTPPTLHGNLALSLDDAIAMGIENNLDVQIVRHQPFIREQEEQIAEGAYDPTLFSDFTYSSDEFPVASSLQAQNELVQRDTNGEAGLRGLFPLVGGSYQIGYVGDRLTSTSSIQSLSPQYTANAAASVALPLLRGLFWSEPWTAVKLSGLAYDQSIDEFRRDLTDIVLAIELSYWNLVANEESLRAADKSLDAANAVLEQTGVQYEVGVVSRVEVVEAEAGVAERDFNRIRAQNAYRRAQDELIDRVLGPNLTPTSRLEIHPTDRPERTHQFLGVAFELDADESAQLASEHRPELAIRRKVIEQAQIGLQFARNQRLPQLDVVGGYGFQGLAGTENPDRLCFNPDPVTGLCPPLVIDKHYASTDDDFFDDDGSAQWYGGAVFSLPLPNRSARANASRAEFELSRARTLLRREEQRIIFEVRDALRNLRDSAQGIEAAERRRAAAEEQHRAETIRLEHGESTPFDVLLRERDLFDAESEKINALQVYRNSLARLDQAQGTTLRSNNIALDDARRLR